jgi:glucokinase
MMRLGLDLGGTKLLAALVDPRGGIVRTARCATGRDTDPDRALALIDTLVAELDAPFSACGLGFPGAVRDGVALSSVMLDGWQNVPFAARLQAHLKVPCTIDNDVNTAALAEQQIRGADDFLFVSVGTGVGGAWVLNGRLRRGAHGIAGEIGHLSVDWRNGPACGCGWRGCVGVFAGGEAAEKHGEPALQIDALAAGIASAINLVDPAWVFLGGGCMTDPDRVEAVARQVRAFTFSEAGTRIEPARAGYTAGALGAALLVAS